MSKVLDLVKIHNFLHEIETLKRLLRHSWLSDDRQESVAEHTWRMAVMALVLYREVDEKIDIAKVLKMILIHDLGEVYAGDYVVFKEVPANKHELEKTALEKLLLDLPEATREELMSLWLEFEERQTAEAKFAVALDKLEVLIQHNEACISTWEEKEYELNYEYAYDKITHDSTLKVLRDLILEETIEKIEADC